MRRYVGTREFDEGETARWRADVFEVGVGALEGAAEQKYQHQHQQEEEEKVVEPHRYSCRCPAVRLDPEEHVAHLWVSEAEVRAGRCGEVELVLTDPDWRRVLLRAFELHRGDCWC